MTRTQIDIDADNNDAGEDSLAQVVEMDTIDQVIIALVGYAGLKPTIHAIKAGKTIPPEVLKDFP